MITTIKVEREKKQEVRNGLIESGYISATLMFGLTDEELFEKIKIKKSWLPKASDLKHVADSPDRDLNCYCLEYNEKTKSYWYKITDLQFLYGATVTAKVPDNSPCNKPTPRPNWFRRMLNFIFG